MEAATRSVIGDRYLDRQTISARVAELGAQISADYAGKVPLLLGLLRSSAVFLADLTRAVRIPSEYDVLAISHFAHSETVRFEKDMNTSAEGRHLIIVEDVIDTGLTLQYVVRALRARNPASVEICALLDRPARRLADINVRYRGFEAPDGYFAGYGLDYKGRFRELPDLYKCVNWPQ